ncbi:hypothetical protein J1G44_12535 [Cellulomonas sp. zg-ZUI199]|uniref:Glycosyltransferase RgtA/B/C/D-like domain-containing protein n=1 Tax=Cellulomonas wangleii TaxID=2816956 RepID=A0ABX8D628_9CELL|nr:hypothetical protein [Cellulomonas wangleii]MBO0925304.1 hypothetical protein [Cellulomonas wangleii]QVI61197.1 hypothetical protein KG103_11890 [Cellulomonas wangleii]
MRTADTPRPGSGQIPARPAPGATAGDLTDGDRAPGRHRGDAAVTAAVALLAAVVAWFRLAPLARDTLWAEDGPVMLTDALDQAFPDAVLNPYAGYLHALPRAVADLLVAVVPPQSWAVAVTVACCVITGLVAALVHRCAADLVEGRWTRISLAALTVAVPVLPLEVLGNLANLHWLMLWATPWILLARPRGRVDTVVLASAALIAGLTEIQTAAFAPMLLWRTRDRARLPVRIAWLVAVAAQLVTAATTSRDAGDAPVPGVGEALTSWAYGAVLTLWTGTGRGLHVATDVLGTAAVVPVLLVVAAACVVVVRRGDPVQRAWALGAPVASVVLYVLAVRANAPVLSPGDGWAIVRYAVVPSMLVASVVVLAVALLPRGRAWRVPAAVLLAPAVAAAVVSWQPTVTARNEGPSWSQQVLEDQRACRADPAIGPVVVTLAPEDWWIGLDCADVAP